MNRLTRARIIVVRTGPLLALVGLTLLVGASTGTAADPFIAGQPSARQMPLGPDAESRALARAATVGRALGLPQGRMSAVRLDDRFDHQVVDEVTTVDTGGRQVALQRFDVDARLISAISLGWIGAGTARAPAEGIAGRAREIVGRAGLQVAGTPVLGTEEDSGGWLVTWARVADGNPVRGDGLRVSLWPDGSFHSITRSERPLSPRPDRLLDVAAARNLVTSRLDGWFGGDLRANVAIDGLDLAWVAPNDMFDSARPDAPAETLRLAWVARVSTTGSLAERLRALEIWLDAGDGSLLGGDVLR